MCGTAPPPARLMRFEAEKEFKKAELRKPIGIFSNHKVKKDRKKYAHIA
jgi:hypothetical protein